MPCQFHPLFLVLPMGFLRKSQVSPILLSILASAVVVTNARGRFRLMTKPTPMRRRALLTPQLPATRDRRHLISRVLVGQPRWSSWSTNPDLVSPDGRRFCLLCPLPPFLDVPIVHATVGVFMSCCAWGRRPRHTYGAPRPSDGGASPHYPARITPGPLTKPRRPGSHAALFADNARTSARNTVTAASRRPGAPFHGTVHAPRAQRCAPTGPERALPIRHRLPRAMAN